MRVSAKIILRSVEVAVDVPDGSSHQTICETLFQAAERRAESRSEDYTIQRCSIKELEGRSEGRTQLL